MVKNLNVIMDYQNQGELEE
ncbi:hypothetical protein PCC21_008030 [Pectobacterium carotovorum subsp. carotovorum PCC21]|nr:hypothetical protein PCC21_008030 [Pectobacterium carotovorum subsp. carotovorum PCC21]